jgi:hypothetical protein
VDGGHKLLISNGERFKQTFAKRDKKQTTIDLRRQPDKLVLKPVMSLHKAFKLRGWIE